MYGRVNLNATARRGGDDTGVRGRPMEDFLARRGVERDEHENAAAAPPAGAQLARMPIQA
jgi:hypothetical protein